MDFLGIPFEVGVKLTPAENSLEIRQKLEIQHVNALTSLASENTPFSTKALLLLLISAFILQKISILGKNSMKEHTTCNSIQLGSFLGALKVLYHHLNVILIHFYILVLLECFLRFLALLSRVLWKAVVRFLL